jgi:crossover junction endodeoxyribonuclease RusA
MTTPTSGTLRQRPADLTITTYGSPAAQGSKRHVGGGRMIEMSKAVAPWREDIRTAALVAGRNQGPLTGPLAVTIFFTLQKPTSAPKRRRTWPSKKPDIDKLLRSTFDALTTAGTWQDDAQVISVHAVKLYVGDVNALDRPGAWISIYTVTETDDV